MWRSGDNLYFKGSSNYNGWASFKYQVTDDQGGYASSTAYIRLSAVNDAPYVYRGTTSEASIYGFSTSRRYGWDDDYYYPTFSTITNASQTGKAIVNNPWGDGFGNDYTYYRQPNYNPYQNTPYGIADIVQGSDGNWYGATRTLRDSSGRAFAIDPAVGGKAHDYQGQVYFSDQDGDRLNYYISRQSSHGHAGVSASGHWYFDSNNGDGYSGNTSFVVSAHDGHGGVVNTTVTAWHHGNSRYAGGGGGGSPVVLDLDGDGIELIGVDDSNVVVDLDRDGLAETLLGWVDKDDALLVYDKNQNGLVDGITEFSFVDYLEGARTDLEGLKAFDSNDDGLLSADDEQWALFSIWQDKNSDGITDEGELVSIEDFGIDSIGLESDWNHQAQADGNVIYGNTQFTRDDGSTGLVGDVYFEGRKIDETKPEENHDAEATPIDGKHVQAQLDAELDDQLEAVLLRLNSDIAAFDPPTPQTAELLADASELIHLALIPEDEPDSLVA